MSTISTQSITVARRMLLNSQHWQRQNAAISYTETYCKNSVTSVRSSRGWNHWNKHEVWSDSSRYLTHFGGDESFQPITWLWYWQNKPRTPKKKAKDVKMPTQEAQRTKPNKTISQAKLNPSLVDSYDIWPAKQIRSILLSDKPHSSWRASQFMETLQWLCAVQWPLLLKGVKLVYQILWSCTIASVQAMSMESTSLRDGLQEGKGRYSTEASEYRRHS